MSAAAISICALIVAMLTMVANVWNTVRAGQWRNSDDGKAVNAKISGLAEKVTVIETKLQSLPTSADFAELSATSKSNHELLLMTRAALTRLEGFFYEVRK